MREEKMTTMMEMVPVKPLTHDRISQLPETAHSQACFGVTCNLKGIMSATNNARNPCNMVVNNSGTDEQANMLTQNHQASSQAVVHFPPPISSGPLTEEDLELWIGLPNAYGDPVKRARTINGLYDLSQGPNPKKEKTGNASSSQTSPVSHEVELTCTICSETIKEESSTKCGHIFCKACIIKAIRAKGKCPTCKTKLSVGSIRRIYLPGFDL